MIAALALAATVYVQPGQTLSSIAASQGASLAAVESANPQIGDPNTIYVGEAVNLPGASQNSSASASLSGQGTSSPESGFQACVISRESSGDPTAVNASTGAGGLYQFLPSTWAGLGFSGLPEKASVATQNQAFQEEYAQMGTSPWAPSDGC